MDIEVFILFQVEYNYGELWVGVFLLSPFFFTKGKF